MTIWWSGLSPLNHVFWGLVVLFTTLFAWQLVAAFSGLLISADGDLDADAGTDLGGEDQMFGGDAGDGDVPDADLAEATGEGYAAHVNAGVAMFRLLSLRSVLAFMTLFSWAAALYLGGDVSYFRAFLLAATWGMAGMLAVTAIFWAIPRLTEEGTMVEARTVGMTATVYVNIPRQGSGQVRVLAGERMSYLRARSVSGRGIKAGTAVRVVAVDGSVLEVEEID